jgi:16S rRNA (adenine1518-N6/adenine1519-N6)-dimethyltransferase
VYLVQREVAERIVAAPGDREYGALSVNVQAVARAEILFRVPAGAFRPPPKVESAVIRVVPNDGAVISPDEESAYREFVIAAFGFRRKQMRRVVRSIWDIDAEQADAVLAKAGVNPSIRPETLTAADFARVLDVGRQKNLKS